MNVETFNNPFSGLKKDVTVRDKTPLPASGAREARKEAKIPPAPLSLDFSDEDEAASALFMEAMGKTPSRKKSVPDDGLQSMAAIFSAQNQLQDDLPDAGARPSVPARTTKKSFVPVSLRAEDLHEEDLSDDDRASFTRAMEGVLPVDESRGRAFALPAAQPPVRCDLPQRDYLAEFTEGKYEFALEFTEEFFEGHVLGLDPLILAKMRAGQYSAETHIDLHGMNAEQAYGELVSFVKGAYIHDYRHLVVVTGRGRNSPGGLSVLRQNMQEWLTKEPLRRVVLAFCTAQPKDGGAGALYVLLRKYKKSSGKVRWDIAPQGI